MFFLSPFNVVINDEMVDNAERVAVTPYRGRSRRKYRREEDKMPGLNTEKIRLTSL